MFGFEDEKDGGQDKWWRCFIKASILALPWELRLIKRWKPETEKLVEEETTGNVPAALQDETIISPLLVRQ